HLEDLARHFREGNAPEKAAEYAYRAGREHDRRFNWSRALGFYADALAALARLPDTVENRRRRVDAILEHVSVSYNADSPEQILAGLAGAEALAQALPAPDGTPGGDRSRLARVRFWMARPHLYRPEYRESIGFIQQSLAAARDSGDEDLAMMSAGTIGWL